jgi:hypothetical protein
VTLFPEREPTGSWWRDHSLGIIVAAILAAQLVFAVWSGYGEFVNTEQDHSSSPAFWSGDFWQFMAYETNMSTLADTYGVLLVVMLTKVFRERGSAESN